MAKASRSSSAFVAEDWDGHGWEIAQVIECSIMDESHGNTMR